LQIAFKIYLIFFTDFKTEAVNIVIEGSMGKYGEARNILSTNFYILRNAGLENVVIKRCNNKKEFIERK